MAGNRLLNDPYWQMTLGERAALIGVVADLKPRLAIEIGTAEGASLAAIAEHCEFVHSFDLVEPQPEAQALTNVEFHTGDNHVLLPELLARLADEGSAVDFALVDGDHSADGVRRDIEDLLASDAVKNTVILMHDTMNEEVRAGIESVDWAAHPKARYLHLDFVTGLMSRKPLLLRELWGGLGIIRVDAAVAGDGPIEIESLVYEAQPLVRAARELVIASDDAQGERLVQFAREAVAARADYEAVLASPSWRVTKPLRAVKGALRKRG